GGAAPGGVTVGKPSPRKSQAPVGAPGARRFCACWGEEARHIAGATNYPGGHTRKYVLAGNIPVSHLRCSEIFSIPTHGSAAKRGSTVG
ncbi:MAG TPA: hypothetical protein VJ723_09010, partial [Candidatus Angelobacter sp.]|nr:hypothetical protein [Candidatus Angelobacter sp.]